MSTLRVDNLNARTGTTITVPTGTKMYLPGHVINVYNVVKTDTFTTSSVTPVAVTGLSLTVTPTTSNSKFLVTYAVPVSIQGGAYSGQIRLRRNGSDIAIGDTAGNRNRSTSFIWSDYYGYQMQEATKSILDSPASASDVTYAVWFGSPYGNAIYINRSYADADSTSYGVSVSTLTVLEIAQ
jgi:hypothetical protein